MSLSFTRSFLALGTLLAFTGISVDAWGSTGGQQEVPVEIARTPDDPDTSPPPYCGRCQIKVVTSTSQAPEDPAVLDFEYDDDYYGHFQGRLLLTIMLDDGQYLTRTIDDVDMLSGETSAFDLEPGTGWTWADDADRVIVRLIPDEG